ncbi:hypothetical protein DV735_g2771, partial [Chaetothyriales sp. CBS 134920]
MQEQYAGRACETCRIRRVKCDKRLSGCARCEKLGQPCSGYKTERRFFDDGAKVRRKFGDSSDKGSPVALQQSSPRPTASPQPQPEVEARPGSFFNTILSPQRQPALDRKRPRTQEGLEEPTSLFPTRPRTQEGLEEPTSLFPTRPSQPFPGLSSAQTNGSFGQPSPPIQHKPAPPPAPPWGRVQPVARLEATESGLGSNTPTAQLLGNYNAYDVPADGTTAPEPDEDFFDLDIDAYYAKGNNACGFIPGLPVIMSDINDIDPNETDTIAGEAGPWPMESSKPPKARASRRRVGRAEADDRGQETAMLLRHFVEMMAPWMDILDIDGYFSRIMPLKATDNVMLRSALAAVAAKRIANVGGASEKDLFGRTVADQSPSNWFYKAASYYDKAISHLRLHLHRLAQMPSQDASQHQPEENREAGGHSRDRTLSASEDESMKLGKRRRIPSIHTWDTEFDDLLSAISVFSLYESLDSSGAGLSQHLNGMQSLLEDKFRKRHMSISPLLQPSARSDKAASAAFWNFAREDLLTAYGSRRLTRLDTQDIALWNTADLPITYEDFVATSPSTCPLLERLSEEGGHVGREAIFVGALIWILMRVVNLVNAESQQAAPPVAQSIISVSTPHSTTTGAATTPGSTADSLPGPSSLTQQWRNLRNLLDGWYESLPMTFDPYAELDYDLVLKKYLYSLPLAAAVLSLYHFGQILLILHQPLELTAAAQSSVAPASRLRMLRAMAEESQSHARQICGIALGGPNVAVLRQLMHPLHLAGLCFEEEAERRLVVELLRGVAQEAHCQTAPLVDELMRE